MSEADKSKWETNPDFLLIPDELPLQFVPSEMEVLSCREYWSEGVEQYKMRKGSIVIKKIAT